MLAASVSIADSVVRYKLESCSDVNHKHKIKIGLTGVGVTPTLPMSNPRCHMHLAKSRAKWNCQIPETFGKSVNDVNGDLFCRLCCCVGLDII